MPEQSNTEWATIGTVVAPFGIRGELKVRLLTDIPNRFTELSTVSLGPALTRYPIKGVRPHKGGMVILKLEGIEDITTAEALRDQTLQIPLAELAKLPPDSYYQHDILGLRVLTLANQDLGVIVDILETGSNDVYDVCAADGKHVLIPAIKAVVKQVDLVRQTMYIDPMPGLLDDTEAILDIEEGEETADEGEEEE